MLAASAKGSAVPGPADNYVAVAAQLRTLTDHPGLNLIILLNRVGDGAEASPSGLVMEIPRFHEKLRMRTNAVRPMPVPQSGREPLRLIVRFSRRCDPFCIDSIYCRGDSYAQEEETADAGGNGDCGADKLGRAARALTAHRSGLDSANARTKSKAGRLNVRPEANRCDC